MRYHRHKWTLVQDRGNWLYIERRAGGNLYGQWIPSGAAR